MCGLTRGHPEDVEVLAESPSAVAILDRFGHRQGHTLVILRDHIESVAEVPWEAYASVQRLAWEGVRALSRALSPIRVYVAALGVSTPQPMSFPHHHVHLIPLYDGGEADRPAEVFTWANGVMVYEPGEAASLARSIKAAWGR